MAQKVEVGVFGSVHNDPVRREIFEVNFASSSVQMFDIHGVCVLGNHYHTRRTEVFTLLEGGARFFIRHVNEKGEFISQTEEFALGPRMSVFVPPYTSHVFVPDGPGVMHCVSSIRFDPSDKDMIDCKIVHLAEDGSCVLLP